MLVTCLCITRNRRDFLPYAIRYFDQQTYPHKELLIVADGERVDDLVPVRDSIRLIHIDEGLTVGTKRNLACSHAKGDVIAHHDDDDYYSPRCLNDRVDRLIGLRRSVFGYNTMRFLDMRDDAGRWWLYRNASIFAVGASLCYRKDWWAKHQFESMQVGEDSSFVEVAERAGMLATSPSEDYMYATLHAGNTVKQRPFGEGPFWGVHWRRINNP